jgi:four helix bundle protein
MRRPDHNPNADKLLTRTRSFGVRMLRLVDALPAGISGQVIGNPLARSATSAGAHDRACCRARSRDEFVAKRSIVIEEADESAYWLQMIVDADELTAIFSRSRATARRDKDARKNNNRTDPHPNQAIRDSTNQEINHDL